MKEMRKRKRVKNFVLRSTMMLLVHLKGGTDIISRWFEGLARVVRGLLHRCARMHLIGRSGQKKYQFKYNDRPTLGVGFRIFFCFFFVLVFVHSDDVNFLCSLTVCTTTTNAIQQLFSFRNVYLFLPFLLLNGVLYFI